MRLVVAFASALSASASLFLSGTALADDPPCQGDAPTAADYRAAGDYRHRHGGLTAAPVQKNPCELKATGKGVCTCGPACDCTDCWWDSGNTVRIGFATPKGKDACVCGPNCACGPECLCDSLTVSLKATTPKVSQPSQTTRPPQFVPLEERVADLEKRVAAIERKEATRATAAPVASTVVQQYRQVCVNGVCQLVPVESSVSGDDPTFGQAGPFGGGGFASTGSGAVMSSGGRVGLFQRIAANRASRRGGGCAGCGN